MLTIKTVQAGKEIFFRVKKLEMEDSVFNIVLPAKKIMHTSGFIKMEIYIRHYSQWVSLKSIYIWQQQGKRRRWVLCPFSTF